MSSSTHAVRDADGEPIRFAYWVPNVSGGLVISNIEQRTSWDIDYNRKLAQTAENSGFDYALSQITNGNTPDGHAAQIADIKSKATQNGHSVKIGVNAFIVHLKSIEVDLVLTAFLHFQEEVEYFGKRVLPIVHELEQQRALVAA